MTRPGDNTKRPKSSKAMEFPCSACQAQYKPSALYTCLTPLKQGGFEKLLMCAACSADWARRTDES